MNDYEPGMQKDYQSIFESRIAKFNPGDSVAQAKRFAVDEISIYPDRVGACVLYHHDGRFDILVGDNGVTHYDQRAHTQILEENRMGYKRGKTFFSILMIAGSDRYMIVDGLDQVAQGDREILLKCLHDYKIKVAFAADSDAPVRYNYDKDPNTMIVMADIQDPIFKVLYDDTVYQQAQTYGLTNFERLHWRITGELPEDVKERLRNKVTTS